MNKITLGITMVVLAVIGGLAANLFVETFMMGI